MSTTCFVKWQTALAGYDTDNYLATHYIAGVEMDDFWEILRRIIEDFMRTGELDPEPLLNSGFFFYGYTLSGPSGEPLLTAAQPDAYPDDIYVETRDLGDRIEVLAHLPGFTADQVSATLEPSRRALILRAGPYEERVELPAKAGGLVEKRFRNGVLRLVFKKKRGLLGLLGWKHL